MKINDFNFAGHKAIVRVDFNVHLDENGHVTDETRIRGVPHLYNLATDLHEDKDVAKEHPEIVDQMVKIIYQEHVDNPLFPITMPMERGK